MNQQQAQPHPKNAIQDESSQTLSLDFIREAQLQSTVNKETKIGSIFV